MSWNIALRPDGMFDVTNEVGHLVFTGTFDPKISLPIRLMMLNLIAESSEMLLMLKTILSEVDALIYSVEQEQGEEQAKLSVPGMYGMRRAIAARIKAAEGLE